MKIKNSSEILALPELLREEGTAVFLVCEMLLDLLREFIDTDSDFSKLFNVAKADKLQRIFFISKNSIS